MIDEYIKTLRAGEKEYKARLAAGEYPYLPALDDATIETYILSQVAKRSAITIGIIFFPFRELGTTDEFVLRLKKPKQEEIEIVVDAMERYLTAKEPSAYTTRLQNIISHLTEYLTM